MTSICLEEIIFLKCNFFREHVEALLEPKKFSDELVLFGASDEESSESLIASEHRQQLMKLVIR